MSPSEEHAVEHSDSAAMALVQRILGVGVNGLGPYKSAAAMAEEALAKTDDPEIAIAKLIATHRRYVGSSGFATGLGGLAAMPVTIPADVTTFYMLAARLSASIAIVRGYDVQSEEVRSAVLLTLLGAGAGGVLSKAGIDIGRKGATAALRRVPGRVLMDINKKVGFRLVTKFGEKGAINLVKAIPLVGGGVGASVNVVTINGIAAYSKKTFVANADPATIVD